MIKQDYDIIEMLEESEFSTPKELIENLILNHPLECHICDKSGECLLQDAFMQHCDSSSYLKSENVAGPTEEVEISPLIKTVMSRCIRCGRCAQFAKELAGVRGDDISGARAYIEESLNSEISGNLIDICPVGAINNNQITLSYRIWELEKTETIDVFDAVGSNIKIHSKDNQVIKVTSSPNEEVNGDWISDKTRFAIDGLKNHRIDKPYIKNEKGNLVEASWKDALAKISEKAYGKQIGAVIGDMVDCETMFIAKDIVDEIECRQNKAKFDVAHSMSYRFNSSFSGIDKADLILLIGVNPKTEAAVLNSRIYSNWYNRKTKIAYIGKEIEFDYDCEYLGESHKALEEILEEGGEISEALSKASYPMIMLGAGALRREDGEFIQGLVSEIVSKYKIAREDWNGYNMLHSQASRVGALRMGCVSPKPLNDILKMDVVYLLDADEIETSEISNKSFVIYQGHHGDKLASFADVILPEAAYTEKSATYVNMEGRAQRSSKAVDMIGDAKEGWQVVQEVAKALNKEAEYSDIEQLREVMVETHMMFKNLDVFIPAKIMNSFGKEGNISDEVISPAIDNFYMTDSISRASATMVDCVDVVARGEGND